MARKEFEKFEAVSAVVPVKPGTYHAAIAVLLYEGEHRGFHTILPEQTFATATAADAAAEQQLAALQGGQCRRRAGLVIRLGRCILNRASGPNWKYPPGRHRAKSVRRPPCRTPRL